MASHVIHKDVPSNGVDGLSVENETKESVQIHHLSNSNTKLGMITIKINSKSNSYMREVLQQFPYFKVKFSNRWNCKHEKDDINVDTKHVNIENKTDKSDIKDQDENSTNINIVNIGDNLPFDLDVFDVLINIPQTMTIDIELPLNRLKSLFRCESFFGLDIIDQNMINRYFKLGFYVCLFCKDSVSRLHMNK